MYNLFMATPIFINPPFQQCHGSTIEILPDGSIVVAWFAGTREGHPDTSIWLCKQQNGVWSKPYVIAKCKDMPHWNPVLYSNGEMLTLYFKVGLHPSSWDTWEVHLNFDCQTIDQPIMLQSVDSEYGKMTYGPVRGKMIKTSHGTLIAPSSIEKMEGYSTGWHIRALVKWESVIHRSTDNGKTWEPVFIDYPRKKDALGGIIQPSVWETSSGHLAALFRSTDGLLYSSESWDDGKSWHSANPTSVPNPNSAVDVAKCHDFIAMVYNPISGDWVRRSPLSISVMRLDALQFPQPIEMKFSTPVDIENGLGNYSYPAMVNTSVENKTFAVTYTWNRTTIAFANVATDKDGNTVLLPGPQPYDFEKGYFVDM